MTAAERAAQVAESGFAFAFREGVLAKALRQGHWVLLDEINLAPSEVWFACKDVPAEARHPWMHLVCPSIRHSNVCGFQIGLKRQQTHYKSHIELWLKG